MTLGSRIRVFLAELPELLREHEGKYALIHDEDTPIETFDTTKVAMEAGHAKYHDTNEFVVVRIE